MKRTMTIKNVEGVDHHGSWLEQKKQDVLFMYFIRNMEKSSCPRAHCQPGTPALSGPDFLGSWLLALGNVLFLSPTAGQGRQELDKAILLASSVHTWPFEADDALFELFFQPRLLHITTQ